jgi:hypothetical protein
VTCDERLRKHARPSTQMGRWSKVSCFPPLLVRQFGLLAIRSRLLFLCRWVSGLRTALRNTTTQAEAVQTAYNSSQ